MLYVPQLQLGRYTSNYRCFFSNLRAQVCRYKSMDINHSVWDLEPIIIGVIGPVGYHGPPILNPEL